MIYFQQFVVTIGEDGTGQAYSLNPVNGLIVAIHLNFSPDMASTANTTIGTSGIQYPAMTIMEKLQSSDDAWFYPLVNATDEAGAEIPSVYTQMVVVDNLLVTISQGTHGASCQVTVVYEEIEWQT